MATKVQGVVVQITALAFETPNENYVITQEGLIFASALLESMVGKGLTSGEIQKELSAKEFEKLEAINPLNSRKSILLWVIT